ncbi:MAG: enoyl-CoA hydratase-related protein [Acidimicrobiia bacterium]
MPKEPDKRLLNIFWGHVAFNLDLFRLVGDRIPGSSGDAVESRFFAAPVRTTTSRPRWRRQALSSADRCSSNLIARYNPRPVGEPRNGKSGLTSPAHPRLRRQGGLSVGAGFALGSCRGSDTQRAGGGGVTEYDLCLSETRDGVCTLTLNDPERRNAWSRAMERRYFDLLAEADTDPEVRVIVLTGAGKSFCPGADIAVLGKIADKGGMDISGARPPAFPRTIRKPMIGAVNGACAGIGLNQALCCDVRFAARGARFTTAYARRGLPAEYGTSWLLPRLIGVERALDLLLSGRVFEADEARELGLVSRVCDPDSVLADAQDYARDLAANCSPAAMAAIRLQVYGDLSRSFEESLERSVAAMLDFASSADFAEGVASYAERRPARFEPLDPDFSL